MSVNSILGIFTLCFASAAASIQSAHAQPRASIEDVQISLHLKSASIERAIHSIMEQTEFKFLYAGEFVPFLKNAKVTLNVKNKSVADVLRIVAQTTGAKFMQNDRNIIVRVPERETIRTEQTEQGTAQDRVIKGKITGGEKGEVLAGATVMVKGTAIGAVTDKDGNYVVSVPQDANVLVFSFIGHLAEEVKINGRSIIDVVLEIDITTLSGITVSTGYWETEKKTSTGNIAKVTAKEIEQQVITNPIAALQGRTAGVIVEQNSGVPGNGFNIQIRGRNSLRGNGNNPLYIIDGVPYPSSSLNLGTGREVLTTSPNPINSFSPADIESIEILKDADATAIYGSRGANGVVLITTKKGKPGNTKFDLNFNTGVGVVANKLDLLNTDQYIEMRREAFINDGTTAEASLPFSTDVINWDTTGYTNWQEVLIGGTANITNAQLSVSGGNVNTQYLVSGSYYQESTVYPGDFAYERGSGHFNFNHSSTDQKFNASVVISYIVDKNSLPRTDVTNSISLAPTTPNAFDSLGNLNFDPFFFTNPFALLARKYEGKNRNLITSSIISYNINSDLNLKVNSGYNYLIVDDLATVPLSTQPPIFAPLGQSDFTNNASETWIIEPQLEFQRNIGGNLLTFLIGTTFQQTIEEGVRLVGEGYTSDILLENIDAAPFIDPSNPVFREYKYSSIYSRINYNWEDRFIVNLTGRRDGSSRFGQDNRFANFASLGVAWLFSNESFVQSSFPFISFGKLRSSYGTTGSDQIPDYEYLDTYRTRGTYAGTVSLTPRRLANPEFQWEINRKFEAAIELGFLDDRVLFTTSYYRNRSSNQLVGIPLSGTTGFNNIQSNFQALVQNTGWELELSSKNIKTSDFEWIIGVNMTIPRNKLVEFDNIDQTAFDDDLEVGRSLSIQESFRYMGVDSESGLYSFEDINEDEVISAPDDIQLFPEVEREYFGGIQNRVFYKGFTLDFLFQFVKQTGQNYFSSFSPPGFFNVNQPVEVLNRWQQPGDDTDIQQFTTSSFTDAGQAYLISRREGDNTVVDASFIRLKNVSLSYNFPTSLIERLKLQNVRVYAQGQNLLTFSDYLGLDPETQSSTVLPPLRTITGGIQFTF